MEKSNKRGKIPQSDWPLIMARYEAGETLASIARTYDCSPPAISYVVSRSRDRSGSEVPKVGVGAAKPGSPDMPRPDMPWPNGDSGKNVMLKSERRPEVTEPAQRDLLQNGSANGHATEMPGAVEPHAANQHPDPREMGQPLETRPAQARPAPERAAGNGHANGDQRRTLHLSLGGAPAANGSNGHAPGQSQPAESHDRRAEQPSHYQPERQAAIMTPEPYHRPASPQRPYDRAPSGSAEGPSHDPAAHEGDGRKAPGGNFIDQELRARVDDDIAAFLAAFDAALLQDSPESRSGLREATDRLLRAGARTRIELERLEARMPLPPRDRMRSEPAWRAR